MVLGFLRGFFSKVFGKGREIAKPQEKGFFGETVSGGIDGIGGVGVKSQALAGAGERGKSVYAATQASEREKSAYLISQNIQELFGASTEVEEVRTVWDFLKFQENTQADHLSKVIGFEEWVDMEEMRRRIQELFGVNYKNERSLYPYLKALSDAGLFESTSAGGRRKWRKKDLLIRTKGNKGGPEEANPVSKPRV